MSSKRLLLLPLLLGFLAAPAQGQEKKGKKPQIADWAPAWKVGDWWTVKVYTKSIKVLTRSPKPVKKGAGEPRLPAKKELEIPGFPALRHGVPKGYKLGNVFRFEVLRKETVKYKDDPPIDSPPEEFWVVALRSTQGKVVRKAELWYDVAELGLSKVVIKRTIKGKSRDVVRWLDGPAQLEVPASQALGVPLDWPDLKSAARKTRARFTIANRPQLEQRVRINKKGMKDERIWVLLQHVVKKRGTPRARCLFRFQRGKPFWRFLKSGTYIAELDKHGRKTK